MQDQSIIEVSVYALVDPETEQVRYVGQTAYPLRQRLCGHVSASVKGRGSKDAWIRGLAARGLRPQIKLLETATGTEANAVEQRYIAQYRAAGHGLTNGESAGGVSGRRRLYLDWVMLAVRVPPEMDEQIRMMATERHYTITYTVRALLAEALAARAAAAASPEERAP